MSNPASHNLHDKIVKQLTDALLKKERQMCVMIELEFIQQDCSPEEMKTWTREADPDFFALTYVDALASDILEMCDDRANVNRFVEGVFKLRMVQFGGGRPAYPFRVLPAATEGTSGTDGMALTGDFAANPTGVLAMTMKTNQFIMTQNAAMTVGTVNMMDKLLKDARAEIARLSDENRVMRAERNADKAAEAERELAVIRQHHEQARKDLLVGKAVQTLPILASRFLADKTGAAGSGTALAHMVGELGSSLSPQLKMEIASKLNIQQRALFGEVLRLAELSKEPEKPAEGQANGATTTPASPPATGAANPA